MTVSPSGKAVPPKAVSPKTTSRKTTSRKTVNRTTLYTFGALGGILFGYDLGVIAGVLVLLAKHWHLTALQKGVITASLSVGAMLGALAARWLCARIGRRTTIMAAAVVVIIGSAGCAAAGN